MGELEIIFNFNIILIFRKWVDFVDGRILDNNFPKIKDKFGMLILRKENIFEKKKEISRGRVVRKLINLLLTCS